MKRNLYLLAIVIFATFCLVKSLSAYPPNEMAFQGRLTDSDGVPLDGTYQLVFTFYFSPHEIIVCQETHPNVQINDGFVEVILGTGIHTGGYEFDLEIIAQTNAPPIAYLELGITVGEYGVDPELLPRSTFQSVLYAATVETINGARAGVISGDLEVSQADRIELQGQGNTVLNLNAGYTEDPGGNQQARVDFRVNNQALGDISVRNGSSTAPLHLNYSSTNNIILAYGGGDVGIGISNPDGKLDVNGNVKVRGDLCYTGTSGPCSDRRLKNNISPIDQALEKIIALQGVRFNWRSDEYPLLNFDHKSHIGFIAQDLKNVLPEAVWEGVDGFYSVNYDNITPVLVEAVKELKGENDLLRSQLMEMDSKMQQMNCIIKTLVHDSNIGGEIIDKDMAVSK